MGFLDFLFPKLCFGCGEWGEYVCPDCLAKLKVRDQQKCPMCERMSVFGSTHSRCFNSQALDGLTIGFIYTGLIRKMLSKYKFSHAFDLSDTLFEAWVSLSDLEVMVVNGPYLVISVPLSGERFRARGYNQAELLAKKVATYFGWEYKKVLIRNRDTKKQSDLPRNARAINIRGAFALEDRTLIQGRKVLLVDDVWTTGATMRECTKVLKKSGAHFVWGMALAG